MEHSDADPTRSPKARALQLLGLSSLAVAAPLFDLIARQPDFLVAHGAGPGEVLGFTVVWALFVPALLIACSFLAQRISPPLGAWVHHGLCGFLLGLTLLPPLGRVGVPGWVAIAAALGAAAIASAVLARRPAVRRFAAWLWPAAVLFPAIFLFGSPVRSLLAPSSRARPDAIAIPNAAPVVLVVLDELPVTSLMDRSQSIDGIRYPNFARLAEDAVWFRNAASVSHDTTRAVPAILTGQLPRDAKPAIAASHPDNLFTLLAGSYRLHVSESLTALCPAELCPDSARDDSGGGGRHGSRTGLSSLLRDSEIAYLHLIVPRELRDALPAISGSWRDFGQERRDVWRARGDALPPEREKLGVFERFLSQLSPPDDDGAPGLHFIHLMLPHLPWRYLPSGHEYGPLREGLYPHGVVDDVWSQNEWESLQGMQRHLLQLGFVDTLLGRLLDRLEEDRLYERALVIVVADHGASFQPGVARRVLVPENLADILAVPLFVKPPGRSAGRIDDRMVFTVDVLPTIADLLGISSLPFPVDGRALLDRDGMPRADGEPRSPRLVGRKLGPAALSARAHSLDRKLEAFGDRSASGLFGIGPHPQWVGREAASLSMTTAGDAIVVELDDAGHYDDVQPESGYLPAQISGSLSWPKDASPRPIELAIAINGTIQATTKSYRASGSLRGGETRFSAMVPVSAYRIGKNRIEVFAIATDESNGENRVAPLRDASMGGWSLRGAATSTDSELVSPQGDVLALTEAGPSGRFHTRETLHDVQYIGWAADHEKSGEAVRVLLFVDGRFVDATVTRGAPSNLPEASPRLAKTRFRLRLPAGLRSREGERGIRIFAVGPRGAAELSSGTRAPRYALVDRGGALSIQSEDGQSIPVRAGALSGTALRNPSTTRRGVAVVGWAADLSHREPAAFILAFRGDRLIADANVGLDASEIPRRLGVPKLRRVGFRLQLHGLNPGNGGRDLRLFAVSERAVASEIEWRAETPLPTR